MKKPADVVTLKPRQTRGDETRKRILDAAMREFKRVGVSNASIGEIARCARVSRPTVYFHFPTKEHFLLELQRSLESPIIAVVDHCRTLEETFDVFVRGLMKARRAVGDNHLFSEMLLIYTREANHLAIDDQPLMLALAERFIEAEKSGELRKGLEAGQATLLYLTGVFGYFMGQGRMVTDKECEKSLKAISLLYTN